MGGTHDSGIVASAADMLGMSVVHGMRSWWSVRNVYVFSSRRRRRGRSWCLCLVCAGVGGELVGGLEQGLEELDGVMSV